jgi:hypothetical protein
MSLRDDELAKSREHMDKEANLFANALNRAGSLVGRGVASVAGKGGQMLSNPGSRLGQVADRISSSASSQAAASRAALAKRVEDRAQTAAQSRVMKKMTPAERVSIRQDQSASRAAAKAKANAPAPQPAAPVGVAQAPAAQAAGGQVVPIRPGMGLGKKVMIGGGLLAGGSMIGGAVGAGKQSVQQQMASGQIVPGNYEQQG